jgi:hypothetical protein
MVLGAVMLDLMVVVFLERPEAEICINFTLDHIRTFEVVGPTDIQLLSSLQSLGEFRVTEWLSPMIPEAKCVNPACYMLDIGASIHQMYITYLKRHQHHCQR